MTAKKFWTEVARGILVVSCIVLVSILTLALMGTLGGGTQESTRVLIFVGTEIVSTVLVGLIVASKLDEIKVPMWAFATLIITTVVGTVVLVGALLMFILRP